MKKKKTKTKQTPQDVEEINSVQVGEVVLQSSSLPIERLIDYAVGMLENKTIEKYLIGLHEKQLLGLAKSYAG